MLDVVLKARRRDQGDATNQSSYEVQLGHEDCDSSSPLFLLPYVLNLGQDSCLVGVSCHSPRIIVCN